MKLIIFCAIFININHYYCMTITSTTTAPVSSMYATDDSNNNDQREKNCIKMLKNHIQLEVDTFLSLMAMTQYFTQTSVNRYGFGKIFLDTAIEQREHATKLAEYLMVHMKIDDLGNLVTITEPTKQKWTNGIDALSDAIMIEKLTQISGNDIVDKCNGYKFIVDYVNGTIINQLNKRQMDLMQRMSSLSERIMLNGEMAESDFDKILILEQYIFAHNKV